MMATYAPVTIDYLLTTILLILVLHAVPQVALDDTTASNSKEFFALLAKPGIQAINLTKDISLNANDAPAYPVNLTANLSINGVPLPGYLTRLEANYIANKIRLQQGVILSFVNIILSGTLRGVGQHLDLLTRSDGGAVLYVNTINHRAACLPFDVFINQLASLPPALAAAGVADPPGLAPRNFSSHFDNSTSGPLCWLAAATGQRECKSPYISMISYGAYNQILEGAVGSNGGYNSFFTRSYGMCDHPVSYDCLSKMGGDLCLAAALTQYVPEVFGNGNGNATAAGSVQKDSQLPLALGLGVGLGGALLLTVTLASLLLLRRRHQRHRLSKDGRGAGCGGEGISRSSHTAGSPGTPRQGSGSIFVDMEAGGRGLAAAVAAATAASKLSASGGSRPAVVGYAAGLAAAAAEMRGNKEGLLAAGAGAGTGPESTAVSSRSSSGVTLPTGSITAATRGGGGGGGGEGAASTSLGEVEAARRHLLANAAKGNRGAPLDVKIMQLLGQGSFGKVYKGLWHGTLVALKAQVMPASLSGDARRRHMAVMEAAISSAINHPAVVQTYCYSFRPIKDSVGKTVAKRGKSRTIPEEPEEGEEVDCVNCGAGSDGEDSDADYGHELLLVLEYCDGGSLRAALDKGTFHRGRPWPWDWRRAIQGAASPLPAAAAAADGGGAAAAPAAGGPMGRRYQQAAAAAAAAALGLGGHNAAVAPSSGGMKILAGGGGNTAPSNTADGFASGTGTSGSFSMLGGGRVQGLGGTVTRTVAVSDSLHITGLAPELWPKLGSYVPNFRNGASGVLLPMAASAPAAVAGSEGAGQTKPAGVGEQTPGIGAANTASTTCESSSLFTQAAGGADPAAAAAAAANRMAMMYLLQQAATAVATSGDPGVGGYAKALAEFVSASNITDLHNLRSLAFNGSTIGAPFGGAGVGNSFSVIQVLEQSMGVTNLALPPAATEPLAGAAPAAPEQLPSLSAPNAPFSAGARPTAQSMWSPVSDGRLTAAAVAASAEGACSSGGGGARVQPALRYGLMLAVASDVASGLLHLHAHGVVHGDVKASNVLLKQIVVTDFWEAVGRAMDGPSTEGPTTASSADTGSERGPRLGLCAKVSDFGLSTMISTANTDTHISATTAAGSLSHMSPELLLCGHVSKANDVYAYGVLLFELFTGERAWEGMPRALLPARVALEGWRPVFPPHTPAEYRQLAERCWHADPAKRPSFDDIVTTIRSLRDAANESGQAEWVPVPPPQQSFLQQIMQQQQQQQQWATPAGAAAAAAAAVAHTQPQQAEAEAKVVVQQQQQVRQLGAERVSPAKSHAQFVQQQQQHANTPVAKAAGSTPLLAVAAVAHVSGVPPPVVGPDGLDAPRTANDEQQDSQLHFL